MWFLRASVVRGRQFQVFVVLFDFLVVFFLFVQRGVLDRVKPSIEGRVVAALRLAVVVLVLFLACLVVVLSLRSHQVQGASPHVATDRRHPTQRRPCHRGEMFGRQRRGREQAQAHHGDGHEIRPGVMEHAQANLTDELADESPCRVAMHTVRGEDDVQQHAPGKRCHRKTSAFRQANLHALATQRLDAHANHGHGHQVRRHPEARVQRSGDELTHRSHEVAAPALVRDEPARDQGTASQQRDPEELAEWTRQASTGLGCGSRGHFGPCFAVGLRLGLC